MKGPRNVCGVDFGYALLIVVFGLARCLCETTYMDGRFSAHLVRMILLALLVLLVLLVLVDFLLGAL